MKKYYYNFKLCKECNGACCKRMPGVYHPKDIKKIFGNLDNAIKSSIVAIDWWEGDKPLYYLRPKTKSAINKLYDGSWGGECIHYTVNGCNLPLKQRPYFCKTLIPKKNNCHYINTKLGDKLQSCKLFKKYKIDLSIYYNYERKNYANI
jgi:hypothetical protein